MLKLGSTIKYVRDVNHLSQRATAEAIGVSDVHLCNLEHDKIYPSHALLERMNNYFCVDMYVLAWCRNGNLKRLPDPVRQCALQLRATWQTVFDWMRDHGKD